MTKESNFANFFAHTNFILIKNKRITSNKGIRNRLLKQIELWKEKKYEEPYETHIKSIENNTFMPSNEDEEVENFETEEDDFIFIGIDYYNKKTHTRNLAAATRYVTQSENKGGFLNPDSTLGIDPLPALKAYFKDLFFCCRLLQLHCATLYSLV